MAPSSCAWKKARGDLTKLPYEVHSIKIQEPCYIDPENLEMFTTAVFKGIMKTSDERAIGVSILPDNIQIVQRHKDVQEIFQRVGLEQYFKLDIWGIDFKRAFQLIDTINEDGVTMVDDKEGNATPIRITEELVRDALKMPIGNQSLVQKLSAKETQSTFHMKPAQEHTFKDLIKTEVELPLRLFSQQFQLGRAERYTQPNRRVAYVMTRSVVRRSMISVNFAGFVVHELKKYAKTRNKNVRTHMNGGHMLTRLAYYALGMIDELPMPHSMHKWLSLCKPTAKIVNAKEAVTSSSKGGRLTRSRQVSSSSEEVAASSDDEKEEEPAKNQPSGEEKMEKEELLKDIPAHSEQVQRFKNLQEKDKRSISNEDQPLQQSKEPEISIHEDPVIKRARKERVKVLEDVEKTKRSLESVVVIAKEQIRSFLGKRASEEEGTSQEQSTKRQRQEEEVGTSVQGLKQQTSSKQTLEIIREEGKEELEGLQTEMIIPSSQRTRTEVEKPQDLQKEVADAHTNGVANGQHMHEAKNESEGSERAPSRHEMLFEVESVGGEAVFSRGPWLVPLPHQQGGEGQKEKEKEPQPVASGEPSQSSAHRKKPEEERSEVHKEHETIKKDEHEACVAHVSLINLYQDIGEETAQETEGQRKEETAQETEGQRKEETVITPEDTELAGTSGKQAEESMESTLQPAQNFLTELNFLMKGVVEKNKLIEELKETIVRQARDIKVHEEVQEAYLRVFKNNDKQIKELLVKAQEQEKAAFELQDKYLTTMQELKAEKQSHELCRGKILVLSMQLSVNESALKAKELQLQKMEIAHKFGNERLLQAEQTLKNFLENPLAGSSSQISEANEKEIEDLKKQLRMEQAEKKLILAGFLKQEQDKDAQIASLKAEVDKLRRELSGKDK